MCVCVVCMVAFDGLEHYPLCVVCVCVCLYVCLYVYVSVCVGVCVCGVA